MRTTNLRRLCDAARANARLVEPLFLLAAEEGKAAYLSELSKGAWFHGDYSMLAGEVSTFDSVRSFLESGKAPARYASVLDAFEAQGDMIAADRRMNGLLRGKIASALGESGMTRYRLCKDLGLNPGNVYAYLAGDDSKVSNATARRMLDYANSQKALQP